MKTLVLTILALNTALGVLALSLMLTMAHMASTPTCLDKIHAEPPGLNRSLTEICR